MSRFLPKLFLRSRPKPILAPLPVCRQGNFCHLVFNRTRQHQAAYNFALQCCQTVPKVAARLKVCILHSRGGRAFTIKDSALWIFKSRNGVCVCGRSILSESMDGSAQYTTLQLFGRIVHQPTKESRTCGVLFALRLQPNNLLSDVDPINPLGKPHKPPSTQ